MKTLNLNPNKQVKKIMRERRKLSLRNYQSFSIDLKKSSRHWWKNTLNLILDNFWLFFQIKVSNLIEASCTSLNASSRNKNKKKKIVEEKKNKSRKI